MCISGSETAFLVGSAWHRPYSHYHQRRHAPADRTTEQNVVTSSAAHGTNYAVVGVTLGEGEVGRRSGSERGRGALVPAGVRSMGSEIICLAVYERPNSAVESAERLSLARSENISLYCADSVKAAVHWERPGCALAQSSPNLTLAAMGLRADSFKCRFGIRFSNNSSRDNGPETLFDIREKILEILGIFYLWRPRF